MDKVKVGVIGCGNICRAYFTHAKMFPILDVAACADLDLERAKAAATQYQVPKACDPKELLKDKSIQIVINLTIPGAHYEVAMAAVKAGKHVVSEKPLCVTRQEGKKLLAAAEKKGVRVGGAPDTFLGSGQQTARSLIDNGAIGRPVAGTAFMLCPGHERWHPNPEFYYQPGGGPMLDMGPYYLTALINLLGPIKRIAAITGILQPDRTVATGPLAGKKIDVQTPDHVAGTIEFESGPIVTMMTSFAAFYSNAAAPITIYGTNGTMHVPDPNGFDGAVWIRRVGEETLTQAQNSHHTGYGRSVGVADMAHAIVSGRPHRASGQLAYAVLDAMLGFLDSSAKNKTFVPTVRAERPAPMPTGGSAGIIDG